MTRLVASSPLIKSNGCDQTRSEGPNPISMEIKRRTDPTALKRP
ncbi:hypothetical protein A2U01_0099754, partial [Trifolium medium]|nr:hypothetical protein [Trifolium medium]